MPDGPAPKSPIVAGFKLFALTVGWLVGSVGAAWLTLVFAFTDWKDPDRSTALDLATKGMAVVTVAFLLLAPLGIAAVAREEGLRRTAVAYVLLTVALAFLALIQLTLSPF